jgi:cytochrome b subunit of formate dehydrogenase
MFHPRHHLLALLTLGAACALLPASAARAKDACFECHATVDNVGEEKLVVQEAAWTKTVHAEAGVGCADCHTGKAAYPHAADEPTASCANCHSDAFEALAASVHGKLNAAGAKGPNCTSCHGSIHALLPASDVESPIHPTRQPETCGRCHADPKLAEQAGVKLVQPIAAYTASVHARVNAAGGKAATCSSCHGSHDILAADDVKSKVHRQNVPSTCAKCHAAISKTYEASVHGKAVAKGIAEAPVCTDCHGEHAILGPADKGSPVFASNVPRMTCGRCHGDLRVTQKFGMKANAVSAFEDSFHGLAGRSGSLTVANCASCHGVHDILPSSDPASHVAPANLAATCGSCHPGAGTSFAIGAVHMLPQDKQTAHPAVYWVRFVYVWMIWLAIGGMVVHNLLDLHRKAKSDFVLPRVPVEQRRMRLNFGFRVAHAATLVSFLVLVWTGFALKFPEGFWAVPLLTWEEQFGVRGWLHRGAAIVMLAAFAFHVVHLIVDRRARTCIKGMIPNLHDVIEVKEKMLWYFGVRKEMPKSRPLNYGEKVEYLALVWGTFVMALTGFVLWFDNWSLTHFPKWVSDVSTVIHFYEAILASLAILVWHLYAVMLDPLVYPMDSSWLTGREAPGRQLERTAATYEPGEKPRHD